jgi:hypothetical protein
MKNPIEAINELIKLVNIAQSRGAYSVKEASEAYAAMEFLNSAVANQQSTQEKQLTEQVERSEK